MTRKSIINDSRDVQRGIELIKLGARLQVLESETKLSYERLLKLYKEVEGKSPPKGMLPFSTDWFMTWQPNVHSSLFLNTYEWINKASDLDQIDAIIKAYKLYLEQVDGNNLERVLTITRAWRLVKFVDAGMLTTTPCTKCSGHYIVHTYDLNGGYVCGLCNPPARAGKTASARAARSAYSEDAAA
ncbi:flagellar transcriptional regulator FlhC [soil metagenome]